MALSSNKEITAKEGRLVSMKQKGGTVIYKGAQLIIGADGYVKPAIAEAGASRAGIAFEFSDATGFSDGDLSPRIIRDENHLLTAAGITIADMGSEVFASSDELVSTTQAANEVSFGVIVEVVSATEIYVDLRG